MIRVVIGMGRGIGDACRVLTLVAVAAILPVAAQASTLETFDWVPGTSSPENPSGTTTGSGTLTLEVPSFTLTTQGNPQGSPYYGSYYTSGADATTAEIVSLQYTFADGASVSLSQVTQETLTATAPWVTSGVVNAYNVPQGTPAGYFLVSGFTLSGTADGVGFMIANSSGTAGTTVDTGLGNGTNTFNGTSSYPSVADGGYWELAPATPVPLPPGLALMLGGLGLIAWVAGRKGFSATA